MRVGASIPEARGVLVHVGFVAMTSETLAGLAPGPSARIAAVSRAGSPAPCALQFRLIPLAATFPAWSARAGQHRVLTFVMAAMADAIGFGARAHDRRSQQRGAEENGGDRAGAAVGRRPYLTMSSSSTSKTSVEPGLISGGAPRSP